MLVRNHWHITENDLQLHSIWPNPPITAYHKTESLKDILVYSRQAKRTSPYSAPNKQSIITTDTLMIIRRPYPSQPTPPNWHTPFDKGDLIPAQVLLPTWSPPIRHCHHILHGLQHHVPPTFLPCYTNQVYQTVWFSPQTMDVLNHVPAFLRPNHMATLNQSNAIPFRKKTPWYPNTPPFK